MRYAKVCAAALILCDKIWIEFNFSTRSHREFVHLSRIDTDEMKKIEVRVEGNTNRKGA